MSNPELRGEWQREVGMIHKRVMTIRKALVEELTRLGTPGEWDYIEKQVSSLS
jgi:aspartate aminotransferase